MRRIRSRDTAPEMAVRRALTARGLRYRLYRPDLPGRPDIVMTRRRLVIFVHGCFWHRHEGCRGCTMPSTRTEFWKKKFDANVARDKRVHRELTKLGWRVETVWECTTKNFDRLMLRLDEVLSDHPSHA